MKVEWSYKGEALIWQDWCSYNRGKDTRDLFLSERVQRKGQVRTQMATSTNQEETPNQKSTLVLGLLASIQDWGKINFCCLRYPGCGILLQQSQLIPYTTYPPLGTFLLPSAETHPVVSWSRGGEELPGCTEWARGSGVPTTFQTDFQQQTSLFLFLSSFPLLEVLIMSYAQALEVSAV